MGQTREVVGLSTQEQMDRSPATYRVALGTSRGFTPELADEMRHRFSLAARPRPAAPESWLEARVDHLEDLVGLVYRTRIAQRVLVTLTEAEIRQDRGGLDDLEAAVAEADPGPWFGPVTRFAVRCDRHGHQAFTSQEAAARAGGAVIDRVRLRTGRTPVVDLEEPDLVLRLEILDNRALLGVDLSGDESLHRRGYLVRPHRAGLKPTVAAALLDHSGWRPGETLLDPMCGGGTLLLEAALETARVPAGHCRRAALPLRRLPPFAGMDLEALLDGHDEEIDHDRVSGLVGADISQRTLENARENARAAGLAGQVEWRRCPIGSLPGDLAGRRFRRMVTNPPHGVRMGTPEQVEATHRRLLRAIPQVLEPGGTCVLVTSRTRQVFALAHRLGLEPHHRTVFLGSLKAALFLLQAP